VWGLSERVKTRELRRKLSWMELAAEWTRRMSLEGLTVAMGLLPDNKDPERVLRARSHVSHKLSGSRCCTIGELLLLARHLRLDVFLGEEAAVRCLLDEVCLEDLEKRLREVRWSRESAPRLEGAPTRAIAILPRRVRDR